MRFWDWFWLFFWLFLIVVPVTALWVSIMIDLVKRPDLVGWRKALWALAVICFPLLGALAYLIARPAGSAWEMSAQERRRADEQRVRNAIEGGGVVPN
ncbi:MAG TPA: PLD nuclease N-terminal domain-containing protein [Ktedonobacterales bacterium]